MLVFSPMETRNGIVHLVRQNCITEDAKVGGGCTAMAKILAEEGASGEVHKGNKALGSCKV